MYNSLLFNPALTLDLTLDADPNVERRRGLWVFGSQTGTFMGVKTALLLRRAYSAREGPKLTLQTM